MIDRIAIITYAGTPGLVLDSTTADQHDKIMNALNRLEAGGSITVVEKSNSLMKCANTLLKGEPIV